MTATATTTRRTRSARAQQLAPDTIAPSFAVAQTASITRSALKSALADVGKALAGKSTLPVLAHVLISAEEGQISLTATDLTIAVTRSIEATVNGAWRVTAPGKLLTDVVSALPEGTVTLTYLDSQQAIKIVAGSFETILKGMEADEFPQLPEVQGTEIELDPAAFTAAVEATAFAAASDTTRPILQAVHIQVRGTTMTLTGTDGLRLAQRQFTLNAAARDMVGNLLGEGLAGLAPIFKDAAWLRLTIGHSQAALRAPGCTAIVRIIEGTYPDVARVIPTSYTTRLVVDRQELHRAIKLAGFFAADSSNIVRLTPAAGTLTIAANAAETGDQKAVVEAMVAGACAPIALNVKFLAEALDTIDTTQVALELDNPQRPALLRPVGEGELLQLIMPMTIR